MVPGGGQPAVAARQVVRVSGHAGDAPALAPLDGGETLDLCATARSSADRQGASSANRSVGTGKSAVGLPAHCGRAERPRHRRIGNYGQEDPARGTARSRRHAQGSIMAGVLEVTSEECHRRGFLHGRPRLAPAVIRVVLHRGRQPSRPSCRVHSPPRRRVGHPTGAAGGLDVRRTRGTGPFLIRDHDRKFTGGFDTVLEADNIRILRTPIHVPEANGIAERFVRTARSECLDWLLILSLPHLERTLTVFVDHYNGWRPHRSLDLAPPNGRVFATTWAGTQPITLKRRDRLGGLLHEYERAA